VNIWQSYKQKRDCLVHSSSVSIVCVGKARKMHETITTLLLVTLPYIHQLIFFTRILSNKPFLIWLLTTLPHLKYVTTLPYNFLSIACFADIKLNVSQASVATDARCGGMFNIHLAASLLRNLSVEKFCKLAKI